MWSPSRLLRSALIALGLSGALALSACSGLTPVYGERTLATERQAFRYAEPTNRLEQVIYQELVLRFGRSAQHHTQAAYVAADLADRMRANRTPVDGYAGSGSGARAIADLAEWRALVAAHLPGGAGEVRFLAGTIDTPATYAIRVSWQEIGAAAPLVYELRLEI